MAAFVLDFSVVFFAHSFLAFVIKREQEMAMIGGFQLSFIFWLSMNVFFFLLLYFLYNYVALLVYKTTVGKFAFRIRLRNIWGMQAIDKTQAFRYSFWKTLSLISLGFAFVGVFVDSQRRTLHEKLSDTMALTHKQKHSAAPTFREKQFFKGLLLPSQFFVALLIFYGVSFAYHSAQTEVMDSTLNTSLVPKCDWVDSEYKAGGDSNRLGFAISLFLLSDIDEACLEKEARAAFESEKMLEEAYMAFALLYPEDKNRFLADACEISPGSFSCFHTSEAKALHNKPYEVLWQAQEAFEERRYEASLSLLSQIKNTYYQSKMGYLKFKNFWKLKQDEILTSLPTYSALIEEDTYDKVVAWACLDAATKDCGSLPNFCERGATKEDFSRAGLVEEMSYIRIRECTGDWTADLPYGFSEEAADLYYAKWRLAKHKDLRPLRDLVSSDGVSVHIKGEVANTMLRHGDLTKSDIEVLSRYKTFDEKRQPASE